MSDDLKQAPTAFTAPKGKKYKPGKVLRVFNDNGDPILVNSEGIFQPLTPADTANLEYHALVGNIEVV